MLQPTRHADQQTGGEVATGAANERRDQYTYPLVDMTTTIETISKQTIPGGHVYMGYAYILGPSDAGRERTSRAESGRWIWGGARRCCEPKSQAAQAGPTSGDRGDGDATPSLLLLLGREPKRESAGRRVTVYVRPGAGGASGAGEERGSR